MQWLDQHSIIDDRRWDYAPDHIKIIGPSGSAKDETSQMFWLSGIVEKANVFKGLRNPQNCPQTLLNNCSFSVT